METEVIKKSLEAANNFGLGVFLSVIIALALMWFVVYVLSEFKKDKELTRSDNATREKEAAVMNEKREERLAQIIERDLLNLKKAVDDHDKRTSEAIGRAEETAKRQREEHDKVLSKQDAFALQTERIVTTLKEVSETLHEIRKVS